MSHDNKSEPKVGWLLSALIGKSPKALANKFKFRWCRRWYRDLVHLPHGVPEDRDAA